MKIQGATIVLLLAVDGTRCVSAFENFFFSLDTASSLDELIFAAANLSPLSFQVAYQAPAAPSSFENYDDEENEDSSSLYYQYNLDAQPISRTISLTKEEKHLFRMVREVRDKYCPNTTLRIAGGWVRDKLLGRESTSPDIDFVLSDQSGSDFARLFHDYYYRSETTEEKSNRNSDHEAVCYATRSSSSSQQVAAAVLKEYDKTKSKHLQTASLKVGNFWIDFCQLRLEKYNGDSRVPEETGIARAVEDAFRRDLTINALFYNLNTNQVEDWCEQGLQDLQFRNIATPVAPLPTLLEDPLRILRAIRFAAQLSFSMDPALKKAAVDKRVRHALQRKVSKERMGNEIDSIFQTNDPTRGVALLIETNLVGVVFPLRDKKDFLKLDASPSAIYKAGFYLLFRTQALVSRIFTPAKEWDENKRRFLWYAAFLKPFSDVSLSFGRMRQGGKRSRRDGSILYQLLNHGLKRPNCDVQSIEGIIKGAGFIQTLLRKHGDSALILQSLVPAKTEELQVATLSVPVADLRWLYYRILKRIGPLWKESLILALASSAQQEPAEAVKRYEDWVTLLEDRLGLSDAIFVRGSLKPMLNGFQIQKQALPGIHGEAFKQVMKAQEEWQVRHCFCNGAVTTDSSSDKKQEAALIDHLIRTFPEYQQQTDDDCLVKRD